MINNLEKTSAYSDVLIGLQYGDEGKARILDKILDNIDVVARFNGGANAGHTLKVKDIKIALHQIPSSIFHENILLYIGSGCVINPKKTVEEIDDIHSKNINIMNRLFISPNASLVQPSHLLLDSLIGKEIGTTGNGIGPAYADQCIRAEGKNIKNIKIGDFLANKTKFRQEISKNIISVCERFDLLNIDILSLTEEFCNYTEQLEKYVVCDPLFLEKECLNGKNVFFEGANSVMLDPIVGTVPFVTSSRTISAAAYTGGDLSIKHHRKTIGVAKAIMSRVGNGPFISELGGSRSEKYCAEENGYKNTKEVELNRYDVDELLQSDDLFEVGIALRIKGDEYGATTKRPRRIGILDLVMLKQNVLLNSVDEVYLNKVDCLRDFSKTRFRSIPIVTAYKLDGKKIDYLPTSEDECRRVEPVIEFLPSFSEDLSEVQNYDDLPVEVKNFLEKVESFIGVKIAGIGIGPERDQFILKKSY